MQSSASVLHSIYRVVFRAGSPQRIQYSDGALIGAILATTGLLIATQVLFFESSIVETGLGLFTALTGTYLLAALLTRKAPRGRLRQSLLTMFLIFAAAQVILLLAAPLTTMASWVRPAVAGMVVAGVLAGVRNAIRYALMGSAVAAWSYTLAYALALGAFYATMAFLLEIVFG